jgi:ClpP class serine protease
MEKTEKMVKYKEPILIITSIIGSIGVFGGFVAYIVQGQVKYSEQLIAETALRVKDIEMLRKERELRKAQIDAERELRKAQIDTERELRKAQVDAKRELRKAQVDAERELRMAQQLLLEAKLNENKAVIAAELRGRLLDELSRRLPIVTR